MHCKITFYSDNPGVGTVINQFKRTYEFKKEAWHDPSTLPTKGMYVVIRLEEGSEKIVDIKASKYQIFNKNSFVTENDFWNTEDDDALAELEDKKREDFIAEHAAKIDVNELLEIEESSSIDECLDIYFHHHITLINRYKDVFESSQTPKQLDYFKLKRFLEKALSQLMYVDKRIPSETFHKVKQELTELEFMTQNFAKFTKIVPEELFNNIYLRYQVSYFAVKKRLMIVEENNLSAKAKLNRIPNELKLLESKIVQTKDENAKKQMKEKIEALKELKNRLDEELRLYELQLTKLKNMLENFSQSKLTQFIQRYEEKKQEIYQKLNTIINIVAYNLDMTIWEVATKSESVRNTFYKPGIEGTFCCMTFLRYYLKPLNKDLLRDEDKALWDFLQYYDRAIAKTIAIVTENQTLATSLKNYLFSKEKDILVYEFTKPVEFLNWARNTRPNIVLVENEIKSISPVDLVLKARQLHPSDSVNFVIFVDIK